MPNNEPVISLHANAVAAFFLRRVVRLIPFFIAMLLLMSISTCHSGVMVNGHPATEADYQTLGRLKWYGLSGLILVPFTLWVYCLLLVKSYSIEMHKDGVLLKYGILNLNNELLLFTKIQDILINRNIFERMLGVSTMIVQNAMGKPEAIPGLGADVAESLRDSILGHIPR